MSIIKRSKVLTIIIIFSIFIILLFVFLRSDEDSWIKDERGVYVKHGNPSEIPEYVENQQEILRQSFSLYEDKKYELVNLSSQCLGIVEYKNVKYAVDLVHVPRNEEDNQAENQCEEFQNGNVRHFVELDRNGMVVRIW